MNTHSNTYSIILFFISSFFLLNAKGVAQVAPSPISQPGPTYQPAPQPTNRTAQPLISKFRQFSIPFSAGQNSQESQATEVQLYVSNDQGVNWVPYHRQPASAERFYFQASADGEYWFSMQTFSRSRIEEASNHIRQAELKVLVDSQNPKLSLELEPLSSGEVIARWAIQDPGVDPTKIFLSYQVSPQLPFQRVQLDATKAYRDRGVVAGETRWFPQATQRMILVRLEAHDKAGNADAVQRNTPVSLVAMRPDWNRVTGQRAVPESDVYHGAPPQSANQLPKDPFLRRNSQTAAKQDRIPWPASNQQPQQIANSQQPSNSPTNTNTPASGQRPMYQGLVNANQNQPRTGVFEPASGPTSPPVGNANAVKQPTQSLPPGIDLEMSRSKKFALNYSVETVGPSGVGQVELWVTRDNGQTWKPNGVDPDRTSPIEVEVKDDGIYGFRVVVEGGNGLAGQRPTPGDLADIWVGIDQQKPIVNFTSVVYGENARVGELDIAWNAVDPYLKDRPIKLYYSDKPSGPWILIDETVANTSLYSWKITPEVPADIYLKIEAHDKAGNIGEDILSRPIENDGLVPQGKVRSIRPLYPSTEQAVLPITIR